MKPLLLAALVGLLLTGCNGYPITCDPPRHVTQYQGIDGSVHSQCVPDTTPPPPTPTPVPSPSPTTIWV